MAKSSTAGTVQLKSFLLAGAVVACGLSPAGAADDATAAVAVPGENGMAVGTKADSRDIVLYIEIAQELFDLLSPNYMDAQLATMAAESIEDSPLAVSATRKISSNAKISTLTSDSEDLTAATTKVLAASDRDSLLYENYQVEDPYSHGIITSSLFGGWGGVMDDSYVISTTGSKMIDSLSICAAPALNSAFVSLPDTGCSVKPIDASDHIKLTEGAAVIVADRDMEVDVNVGKLKVAEGSVILVSVTPTSTAVYNFHDPGKHSVALQIGSRSLAISPGRHLHATAEKTSDFASINLLDRISHRRLVTNATTDGVTVFSSEFSTLSALEALEPLKKVLTLKHTEARKLANQMIKTSAVLMQLGGNSEEFKYHFKPKMTALVNGRSVSN
ncbi:MAG: hypothetical protein SGJ27_02980 [Candidatus Melainabacteria bacterium]|nr:hypothetical protein [Candidatus Melainabacteria bacterium]